MWCPSRFCFRTFIVSCLHQMEFIINNELKKSHVWLIVNMLSLNIDKTNFVVFHPYNNPLRQKITVSQGKKGITELSSSKKGIYRIRALRQHQYFFSELQWCLTLNPFFPIFVLPYPSHNIIHAFVATII